MIPCELQLPGLHDSYDLSSEETCHTWSCNSSPPCLNSQGELTSLYLLYSVFSTAVMYSCSVQQLLKAAYCTCNLFPPASAASWGVTKPLLVVSDHFCSLFNGTPITFIHFLTQLTSQICWLSENFSKIWRSAKRSSWTSLQNACSGILIFLFFHNRFLHNSLRDLPFFRKSQYWRF